MPTTPESGRTEWEIARSSLHDSPTRWGSLTWVSARPLIASLNDLLGRRASGLVTRLRHHWAPETPAEVVINSDSAAPDSDSTTFFLIGDTGEQDASQYVVAPALSRAVAEHKPAFVMIMSDVIYPAGDVDDYPDGVYRPYRGDDRQFRVTAPLLGLPGNHDWYDGLAGFMYHFTTRAGQPTPTPPNAAYAPAQDQRSTVSRLCRILWRRPSEPHEQTKALRRHGPLTGELEQPGPYYVIRTPELMLVCIDTGIDGTIDERQGRWLKRVSAEDGPKVLVTGKPLVVDEEIRPCEIRDDGSPPPDKPETVWQVVHEARHRYVATVGGDVHNYQLYRGQQPDGPQVHIVSGGGGAFLHATHAINIGANDSRLRARPGRTYFGPPKETFPTAGDSLQLFAGLLVPTVRRVMIYLAALTLGVAAVAAGGAASAWAGAAMLMLLAVMIVSLVPAVRRQPRTAVLARVRTGGIMATIGVLGASVTQLLDPTRFGLYVGFVAGAAALHGVCAALVRRAGWWRPADEFARNPSLRIFAVGLILLAGLVGAAQLLLGWTADRDLAAGSAALAASVILVVGVAGQRRRRRRLTCIQADGTGQDLRPSMRDEEGNASALLRHLGEQNRRWHRAGLPTALVVQVVCLLIGVVQLLVITGAAPRWTAAAGLLGLVLGGLMVSVALLVLCWAGLLLGVTELFAAVGHRRGDREAANESWGRAAHQAHQLIIPGFAIMVAVQLGVATAADGWLAGPPLAALRVAVATVACLALVVLSLLVIDWLRRVSRHRYPWFALALTVPVVLLGTVLWQAAPTRWIVPTVAAVAVALVAVGAGALVGHLSFLGAYWLVIDPSTWSTPTFTDAERAELFRTRETFPPQCPDPEIVPRNTRVWARITSPALGEPGGVLQREVSEIFSSDQPPFYKNFLRLTIRRNDAGDAELAIHLHRVFGTAPAEVEEAAVVSLGLAPASRAADGVS